MGCQERFQRSVVCEPQGDIKGREGVHGLGIIQTLGAEIAIVRAVTRLGGRWQVWMEREGQGQMGTEMGQGKGQECLFAVGSFLDGGGWVLAHLYLLCARRRAALRARAWR